MAAVKFTLNGKAQTVDVPAQMPKTLSWACSSNRQRPPDGAQTLGQQIGRAHV